VAAAATAAAWAISALVNRRLARNAENDNPPAGQFLEVSGVRLHYVERGSGTPLVLLHGNGSMIQDFETSGLIDLAAKNYRVIVFDRPGFGHSDRPRNVVWTPAAQAELINSALERLGVSHAIVFRALMGRVCGGCAGAHISEPGQRSGSCLGLLLSLVASRRGCYVRPRGAVSRRCLAVHYFTHRKPSYVAAFDDQNLWSAAGAEEV